MAEEIESESTSTDILSTLSDSGESSAVLSMHYSSSSFEDPNNPNSSNDESSCRVGPYMYEPEESSSASGVLYSDSSSDDDSRQERLANTNWLVF